MNRLIIKQGTPDWPSSYERKIHHQPENINSHDYQLFKEMLQLAVGHVQLRGGYSILQSERDSPKSSQAYRRLF